jgi:hypothetical protein
VNDCSLKISLEKIFVGATIVQLDRHARWVNREHLKEIKRGDVLLVVMDTQRAATLTHCGPIDRQKCDVIYRSTSLKIRSRPFAEVVTQSFVRAGIHSNGIPVSTLS